MKLAIMAAIVGLVGCQTPKAVEKPAANPDPTFHVDHWQSGSCYGDSVWQCEDPIRGGDGNDSYIVVGKEAGGPCDFHAIWYVKRHECWIDIESPYPVVCKYTTKGHKNEMGCTWRPYRAEDFKEEQSK